MTQPLTDAIPKQTAVVPRVFRYVVRYDAGTAPRPFDGVCSLAICKPRIRASAERGDWVIGFRSRKAGEVTYVMQVTEVLTLGQYWEDKRFRNRRPGASPFPDNIYRPDGKGELLYVPNHVHGEKSLGQDTSGRNVLLSDRFWYFGVNSVPIPNELIHLVHSAVGFAVNKGHGPKNAVLIEQWLRSWPPGVHGAPADQALTIGSAETWAKSNKVGKGCA